MYLCPSRSHILNVESQLDDGVSSIAATGHSDKRSSCQMVLPSFAESVSQGNSITTPESDSIRGIRSATLPNPSLHSLQLPSLKSQADLSRTRSHGFSPSRRSSEETLSLYEYQRKASIHRWHRSKHQQQLEKLLDEYEVQCHKYSHI